ncbi:MAG: adenosylmethionine--8-amino-7-oxononanoate transaminase [Pirellulales bacterium]|nr:adenosylmethionine--8-amino-7-oxononanoate transaminase [Pirellulales bacterium]
MPTNSELSDWDSRHHWHAFTQMAEYESVVIQRAAGVWLFDTAGKRYLDGVSSMWCNLFGHNHPQINAAIREQLDQVAHSTPLGLGNRPATILARRLADITPGDLQHVFFASDGSSAVEVALKMAFQYWQQSEQQLPEKKRFVALGQAYHGDTLGSSSVGGIERFHALFEPLLFDVIRLPVPDPRTIRKQDGDCDDPCDFFLAQLEEVLAEHHEQIAALVIEPLIQAAAGMVFHPAGYLRGVRELTQRYNVLLITDEIVTGCGRTGRMFACDHEGVVPDILCLGKSITGGYLPLAATVAGPEIYQAFLGSADSGRAFYHGHTYGGNPLAAAAALATLDLLQEQSKHDFAGKAQNLTDILARLQAHRHVFETRQQGMIAAVELTPDRTTGLPYPAELRIGYRVCQAAKQRGVWLRPLRDTLVLMPPLSISLDELDLLGTVLLESIEHVTQEVSSQLPVNQLTE